MYANDPDLLGLDEFGNDWPVHDHPTPVILRKITKKKVLQDFMNMENPMKDEKKEINIK